MSNTTILISALETAPGVIIPMIREVPLQIEVPGIDDAKFQEIADATKSGCPVSVLLSSAEITLDAKLL